MKKNLCLIAVLTAMGFAMTGCFDSSSDDSSSGNGDSLPATVGENKLAGETYYESDVKVVFNAKGTYIQYQAKRKSDKADLDGSGKYQYVITREEGTYSWNNTAKTVTLKAGKFAVEKDADRNRTNLVNWAGAKSYLDDDELARIFGLKIYNYAFSLSDSGKALFLDRVLPPTPSGDIDELTGKTFNEVGGTNDGGLQSHSQYYSFSVGSFTITNDDYSAGEYTYNTSKSTVYVKADTAGRESSYAALSTTGDGAPYPDVAAKNAALIIDQFGHYEDFIYKISYPGFANILIEY
jgi:hypothetical protein